MLLTPLDLAKLRNLRLRLGAVRAEGQLSGRHRGAVRGFSQEFAQHRSYNPGDELRFLDWKVYARRDRYFVREFQEEKSLQTVLLVDGSGSMGFGAKWGYACRLAEAFAYLILSQGDSAGLILFDVRPRARLAPRRQLGHLKQMDRILEEAAPGGETDLGRVLEEAVGGLKRRSLIILISDLMGEPKKVLEVVKACQAYKHSVMALQVLEPAEADLFGEAGRETERVEGLVLFEALEGGGRLRVDVSQIRDSYREAFAGWMRLLDASFHRSEVPYAPFYTHRAWDQTLAQFLTHHRLL